MSRPKFDHKVIRPSGDWIPSHATDVRRTIKREQERLKKESEAKQHRIVSILRKRTA